MRIITLEEHISLPELTSQMPGGKLSGNKLKHEAGMKRYAAKLADITGERLRSMDDNGITMQVLSVAGAGADQLDANEATAFAKKYNDEIAKQIEPHADRFSAFAHLAFSVPGAAADELERTVRDLNFKGVLVNGLVNDQFLDDPKFAPVLKRAEDLQVPIYLHPGLPPETVADAYYSGLPEASGTVLSTAGWGWHSETAIHILRLIISGTLDKYPKLKFIIGHMGEMLPMMMVRSDNMFKPGMGGDNQRSIVETLHDQVYITTSGIFTQPPFRLALDTFGIDKIMFSIDYPFSGNDAGTKFLKELQLSNEDLEKLVHGNAEKLLGL